MHRALTGALVLALALALVIVPGSMPGPQRDDAEAISVSRVAYDPYRPGAQHHHYDTWFIRLTREETRAANDSKWYAAGLITGACVKLRQVAVVAACSGVAAFHSFRLTQPLRRAADAGGCLQIQVGPRQTRVTGNPQVTTRTLAARNPDCKRR